jgi:hypothetical protein
VLLRMCSTYALCPVNSFSLFFSCAAQDAAGSPSSNNCLQSLPVYLSRTLCAAFPHDTLVCNRHASTDQKQRHWDTEQRENTDGKPTESCGCYSITHHQQPQNRFNSSAKNRVR